MTDLNWSRDAATWPQHETSRFISAAGLRWHVQQTGEGPDLLLIHGTGASTHSWRGLIPSLAHRFRVVAIDLPGHGFTQIPAPQRLSLHAMAADISQLLRTLHAMPHIVVGHSAGAAILTRMAINGSISPQLIISLNGAFLPFGGAAGHLFSPLAKLLVLNPIVPRLFAWQAGHAGTVERLLRDTGSTLDAEGVALYRRLVRSTPHVKAALGMMANWQLEGLVRDLPSLKTKLLLVAAVGDRAISPDVARKVHAMVPNSEIILLPGTGHLAHEERPQELAALILEHASAQV